MHTYGSLFKAANGNKVIMDRNLGATKTYYAVPESTDTMAYQCYGFFYQWGRKDPMPQWRGIGNSTDGQGTTITIYGANGVALANNGGYPIGGEQLYTLVTDALTGTNTLPYSVKNPRTFIVGITGGITDWYTNAAANQDVTLWGSNKGIYDPCPKGWQVAPAGTWDDVGSDPYADPFFYYIQGTKQTAAGTPRMWQSQVNGRFYSIGSVKAWYPAVGLRNGTNYDTRSGKLWNMGYGGYVWSSNVDNQRSPNLDFYHSGLNPKLSSARANGFSVRCVQE